ncbi:MAG: TAT-variant-translocated molybdopterin oxidoreductase [Gammaproteobacteria bacterium]|nr:TAT-variant-translocated molybdopterin oxidoreductase [Gammaproteobacteria bacterium]
MTQPTNRTLDLKQLRARLLDARGPAFWKTLGEVIETAAFREYVQQEFPRYADAAGHAISRRDFMKLMGASMALAGVSACSRPSGEEILPYVNAPAEVVPGKPLFFATADVVSGFASGVLVETREGRPIKVEGNRQHPMSLGATDIYAQAAVLQLWDPGRSQAVTYQAQINTWEAWLAAVASARDEFDRTGGAGLRILTETVTSPTLTQQLGTLLERYPRARWHQYEPVTRDAVYEGAQLAFGEPLETHYHFDKAKVILSLDADFLGAMPGRLKHAREFASGRQVEPRDPQMNRLYAVESTPAITGAAADHRWPLQARQIDAAARQIAAQLGVAALESAAPLAHDAVKALVHDLRQHRGESLVIAGDHQPPTVHALAHAMNERLGNHGNTVTYTEPVVHAPGEQMQSLKQLVQDMSEGHVSTLVILGGNPVYNAPADIPFTEALAKVRHATHLSLYHDETSARTHWHIPATHYLETWSDARAIDGTVTIQQPLIAPLYQNRSAHEVINALTGQVTASGGGEIVRAFWQNRHQIGDFDNFWRRALREGVVPDTALPEKNIAVRRNLASRLPASTPSRSSAIEIIFRPDPTVWDGRYANNAWLQELPKPLTALTWDNAALMSLELARRLELQNEDLVELKLHGRKLRAAVWIAPGHPDDAVTLALGYGRTRGAGPANDAGFNAYRLRRSDAPWSDEGLEIVKTGARYPLAVTQDHHRMQGREDVREATLEEFRRNPSFAHDDPHKNPPFPSLYPAYPYDNYRWGMTVNLNTCIGCKACTIACQAENNIPVVGKQQVQMGREMHWLRVDHYYKGPVDNPETFFQPVPCMHCEHAPCEPVCPVGASIHDEDGLNVQVYNRCVGTRWCSNNCPYKVRRFNWLKYADPSDPHLAALRNPEVTVRSRGVMEKCTYCLQRISVAKIEAEKQGRRVRDGEVRTACQAVCPTNAIAFGDLNDSQAQVGKLKEHPLNYALLAELGTRPRTTYLAKLRNPNPVLDDG